MAGSLAPVMYWVVRTTLCSALWLDAEQLPYQAVMQPVTMFSMVQLQNFLRIWGPMPNLFSLLRGKRCCRALFTTVLVCLDHDSFIGDVDTKELETLDPLHCSPVNVNGGLFGPAIPTVHTQLLCLAHNVVVVVVMAPHCQVSS